MSPPAVAREDARSLLQRDVRHNSPVGRQRSFRVPTSSPMTAGTCVRCPDPASTSADTDLLGPPALPDITLPPSLSIVVRSLPFIGLGPGSPLRCHRQSAAGHGRSRRHGAVPPRSRRHGTPAPSQHRSPSIVFTKGIRRRWSWSMYGARHCDACVEGGWLPVVGPRRRSL